MFKSYYKSPIGLLEITVEDDALISLKISNNQDINIEETPFTKEIKKQLDEYFLAKRTIFDIKLEPKGTLFQQKVWQELLKIPYGTTKTYSDIAEQVGNENSARAVGNACNKNPIMIIIPCHRVVSKNNKTQGYAYGSEIKNQLLNLEELN